MANKLKAVVFIGSNREGRNADRVTALVKAQLESSGFSVTVLDPKEIPFELLKRAFHHYPDPTKAPQHLQETNEVIKQADALVFVISEYNRSAPPALVNMIDHFSPAVFGWKPALPVSYSMGPVGGALGAVAMLPIFREMGLYVTPSPVTIGTVDKALSADGQVQPGFEYTKRSLELGVSQLAFLANALKPARQDANKPKVQSFA